MQIVHVCLKGPSATDENTYEGYWIEHTNSLAGAASGNVWIGCTLTILA
jgi:hypothetical protein